MGIMIRSLALCGAFMLLVGVETVLQRTTGRVWFGEGGIIPWRDFGIEF